MKYGVGSSEPSLQKDDLSKREPISYICVSNLGSSNPNPNSNKGPLSKLDPNSIK